MADMPANQIHTKADKDRAPVLFIGHGSPMNAIEENRFGQSWYRVSQSFPRPSAILCISAHWITNGVFVTAMDNPRTIHDFYGFPKALYDVSYPALGNPKLSEKIQSLAKKTSVRLDYGWGLDHGAWSVLKHLYPNADVPVVQLSLDRSQPSSWHYDIARELSPLREQGVLILGSGNIVHNLRLVDFSDRKKYEWAREARELINELIASRQHRTLIEYEKMGEAVQRAIPTPDHYWPLLYALALQQDDDSLEFMTDEITLGSISMTSLKIG